MSDEELRKLREEEETLRKQMEELSQKQREIAQTRERVEKEEEHRREMEKEITVSVTALSGGSLIVKSGARPDIIELWKSVPGRAFRGYAHDGQGKNLIPVKKWEEVQDRLMRMPHVTLKWEPGVEKELDWWLNAPPWEITMHPSGRHILAKMGPRQSNRRILSHIPSSEWDWDQKSWKIPATEGWRIPKAFEEVEGVVYDEEARKLIFEQVHRRSEMDKIAAKDDSDRFADILTREVTLPTGETHTFWDAMRPFQRVGVEFMYETGGRMLEADATGLGKTWQSLAFAEVKRHEMGDDPFTTLCVVKASNIPNWRREIERLTGVEPVVCRGGEPDGWIVHRLMQREIPYVIISYDTLGRYKEMDDEDGGTMEAYLWATIFQNVGIDLVIADEAHQIKTPSTHRSKATRMLAGSVPHVIPMTASPVLGRTEEIWPILFMTDPKLFKSHEQFLNTYTINGKQPRNVEELHELLRPMFLRRKKSDVMKDLPAINRIVRYHDLSDDARRRYDEVLQGVYEKIAIYDPQGKGGEQVSVMSILAQITRLKQVCAADKVEYTADLATELVDEGSNGHAAKALIFTHFKATAVAIARRLGGEAVCTVKATEDDFVSIGADERDRVFEDARHDPNVRFIVTTEAAKEGHNLEFCDYVIFNDPFWTPASHDQCEGRAYGRLSNPHPIDSLYIIADIDVEKWIMELLEKKLAIIEETVEGVESSRDLTGSIGSELIEKIKDQMWQR